MFLLTGNCITRSVQAFNKALDKAPVAAVATGVFILLGFGLYMASGLAPSGLGAYLVYVGLAIVAGLIAFAALLVVARATR